MKRFFKLQVPYYTVREHGKDTCGVETSLRKF